MKLAQWSIILGASSMALAATPAINPGHEFHLQRRALELPEQDVHLFARSPIPPIGMAPEQIADGNPMTEMQERLRQAVAGIPGQPPSSSEQPGGSGQGNRMSPELAAQSKHLEEMTKRRDALQRSLDKKLERNERRRLQRESKQNRADMKEVDKINQMGQAGQKKGVLHSTKKKVKGIFRGKNYQGKTVEEKQAARFHRLQQKRAARSETVQQKKMRLKAAIAQMRGR
ncbi:hypothetical protein QVD99_003294 [Batrachochytrium dendrobatidis]|nr:hypothetical protein QVD99_003294 [Batrachochytrium dendrobatidis]